MKPLFSFVVPTFNSEFTIEKCIFSILDNGNSQDFEIIIVDDGSEDSTISVVGKIIEKHSNVKLIRSSHNGALKTRIIGLNFASGTYVYFIDSDDEIYSSFNKTIVDFQKTHSFDVLLINANLSNNGNEKPLLKESDFEYIEKNSALKESILYGRFGYNCCHIFRTSFLKQMDFNVLNNLFYTEDLYLYILLILNFKGRVLTLNECLYKYNFENHKLFDIFSRAKFESALFVIKQRFLICEKIYPNDVDSFIELNRILVVDWLMAIFKTRKIQKIEKKEILKVVKEDEIILKIMDRKPSILKFKEFIKYYLFWIFK